MPTYEYRCTECDHAFEARQAFTDDAIEVCPTCGGRVRKLFGNVGIVFKGSGFYKTDSRDKKTAVATADSGGSASEGSSSNGSDKESKPSADKVSAEAKPSGGSNGSTPTSDSGSATPAAKPVVASSSSSSDN
ncbi:MAG TPA: FmdB family zinc ribbon protein [Acidimicrobiales bacterium]|nr:FmdB family zinc ribbon protein [Acidimicrobiales bacterium]